MFVKTHTTEPQCNAAVRYYPFITGFIPGGHLSFPFQRGILGVQRCTCILALFFLYLYTSNVFTTQFFPAKYDCYQTLDKFFILETFRRFHRGIHVNNNYYYTMLNINTSLCYRFKVMEIISTMTKKRPISRHSNWLQIRGHQSVLKGQSVKR